jgi:hypothetical protein
VPKSAYPAYAAKTHVLGFDFYPLSQYCYARRWGIDFDDVYNYQRELTALTSGPPTSGSS